VKECVSVRKKKEGSIGLSMNCCTEMGKCILQSLPENLDQDAKLLLED